VLDPYRNSQHDIEQALEYGRESIDAWSDDACFTEKRSIWPLKKIRDVEDYGSWGQWNLGELLGLDRDELRREFTSYRGQEWADKAIQWINFSSLAQSDIPAVVIIDSRSMRTQAVADGRGRVSLATGLALTKLPVIQLVDCKKKH
jgi:hypothetical protein